MIPAFIIDQILKREIEERARRDRMQIELPLERRRPRTSPPPSESNEDPDRPDPDRPERDRSERGVVVLDLG